jgi:hypothetical protein
LLDEHGVVISGGQGKMAGKMWRWGTMGAFSEADMVDALRAFEEGYAFDDGAAVNAALDVSARAGKQEGEGTRRDRLSPARVKTPKLRLKLQKY